MSPQPYYMKVQAMQYDGTIRTAGSIMEWTNYKALASGGKLTLNGFAIEENYWVIQLPNLRFLVVPEPEFSTNYELWNA